MIDNIFEGKLVHTSSYLLVTLFKFNTSTVLLFSHLEFSFHILSTFILHKHWIVSNFHSQFFT